MELMRLSLRRWAGEGYDPERFDLCHAGEGEDALTCFQRRICFRKLVEVAGVEPASSKLLAGLLRAQPAVESQAVKGHRRSMTAPARKGVPSGPRAGPSGKSLKMTPVNRPSDWAGVDAPLSLFKQRERRRCQRCRWHL